MPSTTAAELRTLLEVQDHDTALDRLAHRRESLPEREARRGFERERSGLDGRIAEVTADRDELAQQERRLDQEADAVQRRVEEVERTLYSGSVTSPRELQAMQTEVDSLRRHHGALEDRELEAMEQREALDGELAELGARRAELDAEIERLAGVIGAAEADLADEEERERSARDELAAAVDPALLADYRRRRQANRGIGIARLVGGRCQGCGLAIPAVEVDRFRHAPEGTLCEPEDCRCILVPS